MFEIERTFNNKVNEYVKKYKLEKSTILKAIETKQKAIDIKK